MNTRTVRPSRADAHRGGFDTGRFACAVRVVAAAATLLALLVGLPWALVRIAGWPLPDHLPTWAEISGVLLEPLTVTFLLDVLVCVCWLLWGLFIIDLARSALDIVCHARFSDLRAAGPMRRTAAVLASTVLISVLVHRAALAVGTNHPTAGHTVDHHVAATARPAPSVSAPDTVTHILGPWPAAQVEGSVAVLPPDPITGVHDSLWRIADRTLGDGDRWPEIFALNRNKPQPGGGTFTRPSLIYPGERLRLPADATIPAAVPDSPPDHPKATPHPNTPPPPSSSRAPLPAETPEPPKTTSTPAPTPPRSTPANTGAAGAPGIRWGEEVFVGIGLAAAVSTALTIARRRQRSRYRPGSGDRNDLAVPPVVYQLRLAHLRADQDGRAALDVEQPGSAPDSQMVLGIRDGRQAALDLAVARGLGMTGPGAPAAIRALVVSAAATAQHQARPGTRVVVPAKDVAILHGTERYPPNLGDRHATGCAARRALPACVRVPANLDAALDALEAEILVRTNSTTTTSQDRWPPLLLVARPSEQQRQRLQAILDIGATVGVTGLLLGQWTAGATVHVRENGTISTTNPGVAEPLRGTQVFRLGIDDTADLLTLLHDADPEQQGLAARAATVDLEITDEVSAPEPDPPGGGTSSSRSIVGHDRDARSLSGKPLRITVLGPPRVWWNLTPEGIDSEPVEREITAAFQPRLRELLVFLALHPDGATREALVAALWATSTSEKTTNAMNTSFSRLRRALNNATEGTVSDVVLAGEGRYRLDPDLVEVDYWSFAAAVTTRRIATNAADRIEAYRRIVDRYTGPVADGLTTDWIDTVREAIRRDAIDAVAALARTLVEEDPQQTLDLLEIARAFDPHNELIYRDIMRLQERLGQLDAIPRTLALLTTRLAEVDDRPTQHAIDLADRLRHRHDVGEPVLAEQGATRRAPGVPMS